jgi:hypothetical protein
LHTDAGSTESDSGMVRTFRIRASEQIRMRTELNARRSVNVRSSLTVISISAPTFIPIYYMVCFALSIDSIASAKIVFFGGAERQIVFAVTEL